MPAVWTCRDHHLPLERTLIMGVLNVTPDSFYDGGRYVDANHAVQHAHQMIADGADIIDIGGESSRPGAEPVSVAEECDRVLPVIEQMASVREVVLSVDTTKPAVAQQALAAGAHIINDISAGGAGREMVSLAARHQAGLVLMHMQGEPRTMQDAPAYSDVVGEVTTFLDERQRLAQQHGVPAANLVVDPGIGFGKTADHNWALLAGLPRLAHLGLPVLIGVSRKRFLGLLCACEAEGRLSASLAAAVGAILNGAAIIRVHDVKETCDAARVADRMRSERGT